MGRDILISALTSLAVVSIIGVVDITLFARRLRKENAERQAIRKARQAARRALTGKPDQ